MSALAFFDTDVRFYTDDATGITGHDSGVLLILSRYHDDVAGFAPFDTVWPRPSGRSAGDLTAMNLRLAHPLDPSPAFLPLSHCPHPYGPRQWDSRKVPVQASANAGAGAGTGRD